MLCPSLVCPGLLRCSIFTLCAMLRGSFITLGVFILFATRMGSLLCSGICFMCCAQGSSLHLGHYLFNMCRGSSLCLGHLSYMLCPRVLYRTRDIYSICFAQGLFTMLGHLFYVPRPGSFTTLKVFILSSAFRGFSLLVRKFILCAALEGSLSHLGDFISRAMLGGSSPNSRHLFHHHVGQSQVYTIFGDRMGSTHRHMGVSPTQIYVGLVESQGVP